MTLKDHPFPPYLNTSRANIVTEFFSPALSSATRYDRGVGYFSSGWLRVAASGMALFAGNGGYARWITSPILSGDDWQAMIQGDRARRDATLRQVLENNITELEYALERKTLSALAWMIADKILDFRLAVPANDLAGEFHSKFGIFTDLQGNRLSFEGSYNDSIQGTRNYESIKIFCSWNDHQAEIVQHDVERFEHLWCNEDPNVYVYDLPEATRARILKLRTQDRPYLLAKNLTEQAQTYKLREHPCRPPDLVLRDYQEAAIKAWFDHDCRGLLEMATGTGKTITALAAMARLFGRERRLAIVITCPYQHLVDQWHDEASSFNLQPILAYVSKKRWLARFRQQVAEYNHGDRSHLAIITTHTTFTDADFQRIVAAIDGPTLLIADEAHHLGAEQRRLALPQTIAYRLALSATPDRWFDDLGTAALRDYFGETVFSYTLAEAIGTALTPYRYYPQLVELTLDELAEYQQLSERIAKLGSSDDPDMADARELLLIKRARLLNNAANKLLCLSTLIANIGKIDHALFYCAPEQIDVVCQLLGWDHGLLIHRFTAQEPNSERQMLLAQFAAGELDGLVAMKCLDEGVDVPTTRTAFILASSSNPREFIQRRGRILRRAPGKDEAIIYDLIAIPPQTWAASGTFNAERSIMQHELHRFHEFAEHARNKHSALDVIRNIARRYGL